MSIFVLESSNEEFMTLVNELEKIVDCTVFDDWDLLCEEIDDSCLGIVFDLDLEKKKIEKMIVSIRKDDPELTLMGLSNSLDAKKLIKHQKSKYGLDLYFKTPIDSNYLKLLLGQLLDMDFDSNESAVVGCDDDTRDIVIPEEMRMPPTFDMLKEVSSEEIEEQDDEDIEGPPGEIEEECEFSSEDIEVSDDIIQAHLEDKELTPEAQSVSDKIDAIFSEVYVQDYANSAANQESLKETAKEPVKEINSDDIAMVDDVDDLLELSESSTNDNSLNLSEGEEDMSAGDDLDLELDGLSDGGELSLSDDSNDAQSVDVDQNDELSLDLGGDSDLSLSDGDEPKSLDVDSGQDFDLGGDDGGGLSLAADGDEVESLDLSSDLDLESSEEVQAQEETVSEESLDLGDSLSLTDDSESDSLLLGEESTEADGLSLGDDALSDGDDLEFSLGEETEDVSLGDDNEDDFLLDDGSEEVGDLEFSVSEDIDEEIGIDTVEDPTGVIEDAALDFSTDDTGDLFTEDASLEVTADDTDADLLDVGGDDPSVDDELLFSAEESVEESNDLLGIEDDNDSVDLADNVSQVNIDKLNLDDSQAELKRKKVEEDLEQFLMESDDPQRISANDVNEMTKTTDILVSQHEETGVIDTNKIEAVKEEKTSTAIRTEKDFGSFVSDQTKQDHLNYVAHNDNEVMRLGETIKNLREDREELLKKLYDLEAKIDKDEKDFLQLQSLVDEKKIEMSVLKKRYDKEIDDLKFQLKLKQENEEIFKEKQKHFEDEMIEKLRDNKLNERRIRSRERELEEKIEMLKSDSEVQIRNRDQKILALKRRIDTLEFDIESSHIKESQAKSQQDDLEQKMDRVIDTLRNAIEHLDTDSDSELRRQKLKNNLDV